jgi:hypothetical protein
LYSLSSSAGPVDEPGPELNQYEVPIGSDKRADLLLSSLIYDSPVALFRHGVNPVQKSALHLPGGRAPVVEQLNPAGYQSWQRTTIDVKGNAHEKS